MLRKRAWGELVGAAGVDAVLTCIDCGAGLAGALARLGSLRCHECREHPRGRGNGVPTLSRGAERR